jgi:hypothetical protein
MGLQDVWWRGREWIYLAQDRDRLWAHVNAVMNLRLTYTKISGISRLGAALLVSEEGLCSTELVG